MIEYGMQLKGDFPREIPREIPSHRIGNNIHGSHVPTHKQSIIAEVISKEAEQQNNIILARSLKIRLASFFPNDLLVNCKKSHSLFNLFPIIG